MRFFKVICVMALVLAVSAIAYAETQSVKVSGDIGLRTFARDNYDLNKNDAEGANGTQSSDWATYLMSTAEVQIDADLTDNVSGVIRLVNQRVWGDQLYNSEANGELGTTHWPYTDRVNARRVAPGADSFDIEVDLAYIELKEFLYSPLTLRIGRQDLWFGKGFIVGANLQVPNANIYAPEYTAIRSFDAIRATLDYDPWTIDAVFAKISENFRRSDDDTNLWGLNVGYVFDQYNAEMEGYWWYKQDRYTGSGNNASGNLINVQNGADSNDVQTFGLRGSFDPIEDWTVAAEAAYQFGQYLGPDPANAPQVHQRDRSAWAIDAMVECRYFQEDYAWRPVLAAEYIFYSGEDNIGPNNRSNNGNYTGWDPMFRGKFDTAIREFQNVFYRTWVPSTPSYTNQHQMLFWATVEPTDSITFTAKYGQFWLANAFANNSDFGGGVAQNTAKHVGAELDLMLTWDYTEDVSFDLLTGWFFPGNTFGQEADSVATDVVGSVKLSF